GSFGETYAFYLLDHHIYRFDYYEMSDFPSAKKRLIATIDPKYEIVDVQPLIPGMGLRDEDDCTVALLYNPATHTSTLAFYDTTSGKLLAHYPDIIPGRAVYFSRCL
ncbi:MAG: hypothetical protein K6G08_02820, partial [Prevotella sp.]|nr:hypothetical protein [Prevotella sp.]